MILPEPTAPAALTSRHIHPFTLFGTPPTQVPVSDTTSFVQLSRFIEENTPKGKRKHMGRLCKLKHGQRGHTVRVLMIARPFLSLCQRPTDELQPHARPLALPYRFQATYMTYYSMPTSSRHHHQSSKVLNNLKSLDILKSTSSSDCYIIMKWKSWRRVTIECKGYTSVRAMITTTNDKIRQMGRKHGEAGHGRILS